MFPSSKQNFYTHVCDERWSYYHCNKYEWCNGWYLCVAYHSAATVDSPVAWGEGGGTSHWTIEQSPKTKHSHLFSVLYFICFAFQQWTPADLKLDVSCQLSLNLFKLSLPSFPFSFPMSFCFCTTSFYFTVWWSSLHNSHVNINTTYW